MSNRPSRSGGTIRLHRQGDELLAVRLRLPEPTRALEARLAGRGVREVPAIIAEAVGTDRIAAVLGACAALEAACGVTVDPTTHDRRRLAQAGDFIRCHTRHIYLFHAAQLLGYRSLRRLTAHYPEVMRRARRLSRLGMALARIATGGGRLPALCFGGAAERPAPSALRALRAELDWGLGAARETLALVSRLPVPRVEGDYRFLVAADTGALPDGWERGEGPPPLVGPLARYALHGDALPPLAAALAAEARLARSCRNPFKTVIVRAVELVAAMEWAIEIVDRYPAPVASVSPAPEGPLGPWPQRYELTAAGTVRVAHVLTPTGINRRALERDLFEYLRPRGELPDEALLSECRLLIGSYDPKLAQTLRLAQAAPAGVV